VQEGNDSHFEYKESTDENYRCDWVETITNMGTTAAGKWGAVLVMEWLMCVSWRSQIVFPVGVGS